MFGDTDNAASQGTSTPIADRFSVSSVTTSGYVSVVGIEMDEAEEMVAPDSARATNESALAEDTENREYRDNLTETSSSIIAQLKSIFQNASWYKTLLGCQGAEAQTLLNTFQTLLDGDVIDAPFRRGLVVAMRRLSTDTNLYPDGFELEGIESNNDQPLAGGGFADIYKGQFQGELVCLKTFRMYEPYQVDYLMKVYCREAILWRQLSHPNLLPFYGLFRLHSRLSLVSPWFENGHVGKFLNQHPEADRILLCLDTAAGVSYLHTNNIIHGDLKGANVLVDGSERGIVADFGLSAVTDPQILYWTAHSLAASTGGTLRWQAPELLDDSGGSAVHNTLASDIYAWACVCYEIFTGRIPFSEWRDPAVMTKISRGETPSMPPISDPAWTEHGLTDRIWNLISKCWVHNPEERPSMSHLIEKLSLERPIDARLPARWAGSVNRFRRVNHQPPSRPAVERILSGILNSNTGHKHRETSMSKSGNTKDGAVSFERHTDSHTIPGNQDVASKWKRNQVPSKPGDLNNEMYQELQAEAQVQPQTATQAKTGAQAQDTVPAHRPVVGNIRQGGSLGEQTRVTPGHQELAPYPIQTETLDITSDSAFKTGENTDLHLHIPVIDGHFYEVYKSFFRGKAICVKVFKVYETSDRARLYEAFSRQAVLWGQLTHVNILPFYGIYRLGDNHNRSGLVSPWMHNGDINEFFKRYPDTDRRLLISDVAAGVLYLHKSGVVHGDLKGENVLVTSSDRACLANFGLSSVRENHGFQSQDPFLSNDAEGGTIRFQAPELLDPNDQECPRSEASDVYAFAMVCHEMFTGDHPFAELKNDYTVMLKVGKGERPGRRFGEKYLRRGLTDRVWKLMEDCWKHLPEDRPNAYQIVERLPRGANGDRRRAKGWGELSLSQFQATEGYGEPARSGASMAEMLRVIETETTGTSSFHWF